MNRTFIVLVLAGWLGGAATAWQSYEEAEQVFGKIAPGTTTVHELAALRLDPRKNPNISVVPRFAVMQRFMVNSTVTPADLEEGVRECISAQNACVGWRIDQTAMQKRRNGNAALETLKMRRETHSSGWHFSR